LCSETSPVSEQNPKLSKELDSQSLPSNIVKESMKSSYLFDDNRMTTFVSDSLQTVESSNIEVKTSNESTERDDTVRGGDIAIGRDNDDDDEDIWDDDENPWLGCVCGGTHEDDEENTSSCSRVHKFWIQCDDCQAWYECNQECLGFSESAALRLSTWHCPACSFESLKFQSDEDVHVVTDEKGLTTGKKNYKQPTSEEAQKRISCSKLQPLSIGSVVTVTNRTWTGTNKPGGVARITGCSNVGPNGDIMYDVKYVLGGRESNIESKYVTVHSELMKSLQQT
jgi:hypothetical protein